MSCPKDSSVPGCDAVFRGEGFPTFRKFVVPSPTRVSMSWSAYSEDEGTTTFRNVRYHSPKDKELQSRKNLTAPTHRCYSCISLGSRVDVVAVSNRSAEHPRFALHLSLSVTCYSLQATPRFLAPFCSRYVPPILKGCSKPKGMYSTDLHNGSNLPHWLI